MPALQNLAVEFVSLVDRAAVRNTTNKNEPQRFLVYKAETERDDTQGGSDMTEAEMVAAVQKAETERDELRKQLTDQTDLKTELKKAQDEIAKAAGDAEDEPLIKALMSKGKTREQAETIVANSPEETAEVNKADLPEPVRLALEKAEQDAKTMGERLEKAENVAKAERDERLTRDFITKAGSFQALPVTPGDFGLVLKSVHGGVDEQTFEALDKVLKAADEQISKGELFKEQGRSGDDPKPHNVEAEIAAKAEEIRKSDSKLTKAEAFDQALSEDRDLQSRYLAEIR